MEYRWYLRGIYQNFGVGLKDCPDYEKKRSVNIVLKEFYGKNDTALLKCRTCGHCFSETRGTPFFGLNTSWEEVVRTLSQIPEKGSIRGVARSSGHDKGTICKWVDLAGKHCEEVPDYFLRNLHLDRIRVDEIWSYIKKAKEYRLDDPEDYGDVYYLTAIKTDTRCSYAITKEKEAQQMQLDCLVIWRDDALSIHLFQYLHVSTASRLPLTLVSEI